MFSLPPCVSRQHPGVRLEANPEHSHPSSNFIQHKFIQSASDEVSIGKKQEIHAKSMFPAKSTFPVHYSNTLGSTPL